MFSTGNLVFLYEKVSFVMSFKRWFMGFILMLGGELRHLLKVILLIPRNVLNLFSAIHNIVV